MLQESVKVEDDSTSSSHLTLSPPQLPIHSPSFELQSLRELPGPDLKSADGQPMSSPPLSSSLFPLHIPPSIHFPLLNEKCEYNAIHTSHAVLEYIATHWTSIHILPIDSNHFMYICIRSTYIHTCVCTIYIQVYVYVGPLL